jgi:hypothetical protein
MSLVFSQRGVQVHSELCNSNSIGNNTAQVAERLHYAVRFTLLASCDYRISSAYIRFRNMPN